MDYISQKMQDRWVIEEIFNFRRGGYFVDLAATDGVHINNTLLLERALGWDGIVIEANPQFFAELTRNRQCNRVQACVDETERLVHFLPNGELGGVIDSDTDNNPAIRASVIEEWEESSKILSMTTRTLASILDECQAPAVIDYLSLDVEGAETRIMRSFPFDRYIFLAVTIERPTPELNELLFRNGYVFVRIVQFDTFYIHSSIPHFDQIQTEPFAQVPQKDW
jgi:FkbM family methyltransferase